MIEAAETIARDPEACRAHAEKYFTHVVMAQEYERMYRGLIADGKLPAGKASPWLS
jgi:hypothetical protein